MPEKSQNFPVGRISCTKTFQTKCVNCFCDKNAPKVRKQLLQSFNFKLLFHLSLFSLFMLSVRNARNLSKLTGKLCTLSGNFPDYSETFQTVLKLSRLSGKFPDCLESFQTIRKLSRLSINFPDYPETFQTVLKISRLSGNFPDCPKTFHTVWKLFNSLNKSGFI